MAIKIYWVSKNIFRLSIITITPQFNFSELIKMCLWKKIYAYKGGTVAEWSKAPL